MRFSALLAGLGAGAIALGAAGRDARACGGCFNKPPSPTMSGTVVTDHRMIFSVSPAQTTLYDQIKYSGSPADFAWVLPTKGVVTVGVSSDTLFQALDQVTTTTLVAPQLPPCPQPPSCPCCGGNCGNGSLAFGGGGSSSGSSSGASGGPPPVTVTSMSVVGPYEQSQLHSTDPTALETWLSAHGYAIPASVQPIIAAYVAEGFDFLAIRLVPGQGVQAMRPISVTTPGAGVSLPLRMVAAGTGSTVGITLWVIATGRYEPANFSQFTVSGSELTWDWNTRQSNYATIRSQVETSYGNAAWQVESSLALSPYNIENAVLYGGATNDYLAVPASDAGADAGAAKTAAQVRTDDLATCFPGGLSQVRVTRMRADLSQAALANDLVLQAAADQSTMSNLYQVTQSVNQPVCPTYPPLTCPVCTPGSSSGSGLYTGDDGGTAGGGGAGATGSGSQGQQSFGCSAAPGEAGGAGLELGLAGLLGVSMVARSRRRRGR
jgi:MYXO-CTERM domain-containing protein